MIIGMNRGDILRTTGHIAYAVNIERRNTAGLAGEINRLHWPDFDRNGVQPLGTVRSLNCGFRTFHALYCHESELGGWKMAPYYLGQCLRKLSIPTSEPIHVAYIGGGIVGQQQGADTFDLLSVLANNSYFKFIVYSL